MFLITTADQRFWKKDGPVLFLGEWCRLYSQKALWQNRQQEVLPYHWDDHQKLAADYQYLQKVYERILNEWSTCLNSVHEKNESIRYWRMIVGPWLFFFIQAFYDRYTCIERAVLTGKVTGCFIGQYELNHSIPRDYEQFNREIVQDSYNQFLYSWIIEHRKLFSYQSINVPSSVFDTDLPKKSWLKRMGKNLILAYEQALPHRFNQYVFVSSYLTPKDQWELQRSLKQWPSHFAPEVSAPDAKINWDLRNCLGVSLKENAFEECLSQIISQQIPKAYVEDYKSIREQALSLYPTFPKVIVTANDLYANESFKVFSAEQTKRGTKLVSIQHGGTYGSTLFYASEEHEIEVSDVFYTWGWDIEGNQKAKPLAAAKLNSFGESLRSNPQGPILLMVGLVPRYSYHLYSAYIASTGVIDYFKDQMRFIKGLDEALRKNVLTRLFPQDFDWSQKERFQDEFPGMTFDHQKSIKESMKSCRLCIATYNSTTFLESFTANYPTVIFWNPMHWQMRPSAQKYYDQLKSAGILHETPESAALKVNEIFNYPESWWQTPEVQQAKNMFCERFAKTSNDWLQEWRQELVGLTKEGSIH
jgi:putative transferase (TIGR04331 family)